MGKNKNPSINGIGVTLLAQYLLSVQPSLLIPLINAENFGKLFMKKYSLCCFSIWWCLCLHSLIITEPRTVAITFSKLRILPSSSNSSITSRSLAPPCIVRLLFSFLFSRFLLYSPISGFLTLLLPSVLSVETDYALVKQSLSFLARLMATPVSKNKWKSRVVYVSVKPLVSLLHATCGKVSLPSDAKQTVSYQKIRSTTIPELKKSLDQIVVTHHLVLPLPFIVSLSECRHVCFHQGSQPLFRSPTSIDVRREFWIWQGLVTSISFFSSRNHRVGSNLFAGSEFGSRPAVHEEMERPLRHSTFLGLASSFLRFLSPIVHRSPCLSGVTFMDCLFSFRCSCPAKDSFLEVFW